MSFDLAEGQKFTRHSKFYKSVYAIRGNGSTRGMACTVNVAGQQRQDNTSGSVRLVTWSGCVGEGDRELTVERFSRRHMGNYQLEVSNIKRSGNFSFLLANGGADRDVDWRIESLDVKYLNSKELMEDLEVYTIQDRTGQRPLQLNLLKSRLKYNQNTKIHDLQISKKTRNDLNYLRGSPIIVEKKHFVGVLKESADAGQFVPCFITEGEFVYGTGQPEEEKRCSGKNMKDMAADASPVEPFDLKTCQEKLAKHYRRTATVPTIVRSTLSDDGFHVHIDQIYTPLSWVKQEQTPAGPLQSEMRQYNELFTADMNGVVLKRILVLGKMGIGKSTFVKKLARDWASLILFSGQTDDETTAVLKDFELVVAVDLKKVSKYKNLSDVISRSGIFEKENKAALTEGLINYISKNQEKVLLVFDGYDKYGIGCESEIYKIFKGNQLKNCSVLITTQDYKANELRQDESKVGLLKLAMITGFCRRDKKDMKDFIGKSLDCTKEENNLYDHLVEKDLLDLAKVPLLLYFFCTRWREDSFPEPKTKLYTEIVKCVLHHSQGEVQDLKEILAKNGMVALECLLEDDSVFMSSRPNLMSRSYVHNQLPDDIRCEGNFIIQLLEVTGYTKSPPPAQMVPFIHKSIQEFVAAWYLSYTCVPAEGNLGLVGELAGTLEHCEALEKVFQFVCGLTNEGAETVFKHLTSVRKSDSSLNLSRTTVPDVENETDVPPCDVTERQRRFNDLVFHCFREVESKAELAKCFYDCVGGVVLVRKPLSDLLPKGNYLNVSFLFAEPTFSQIGGSTKQVSFLYESLKLIDKENSKLQKLGDLLETFLKIECNHQLRGCCGFDSCLCFRGGQVYIYITSLHLCCSTHASLLIETANLCSELFTHLKRIRCCTDGNYSCDILEQLLKPATCSLRIGTFDKHSLSAVYNLTTVYTCYLNSVQAMQFAGLLPRFDNIITLALDLEHCCASAVIALISSITHKNFKYLRLTGISMTPKVAAALGKSLPQFPSLQTLELIGAGGGSKANMKALFGGFNKPSPLKELFLRCFNARGSLVPLTESLGFFPKLVSLNLEELNLNESDLRSLLESFTSLSYLRELSLNGNPLGHSVLSIVQHIHKLPKLCSLWLAGTYCLDDDQIAFDELINQVLPRFYVNWKKHP